MPVAKTDFDNQIILTLKYAVLIFLILCIGCKSGFDKEVETSRTALRKLRGEPAPPFGSAYRQLKAKQNISASQEGIVDSLYHTTTTTINLIDSLSKVIEQMDKTGEHRTIGNPLLVQSPDGLRLTHGAKAVKHYCLALAENLQQKRKINDIFSPYKSYLGTIEFNEVYFSMSSSSFILMVFSMLKTDISNATFFTLSHLGN